MNAKLETPKIIDGWKQAIHCVPRHILSDEIPGKYDIHFHDYIEFLYGLSGVATVLIGDKSYELREGDLVVVNAGAVHTVYCDEGHAEYYVVKFLPDLLYAQGKSILRVQFLLSLWQNEMSFRPALRAETLKGSGIDRNIRELMREWEKKLPGYELTIYAHIIQVFIWILRNCCSVPVFSADIPEQTRLALEGVLAESANHLYDDWTARQASDFAHLSYSYFSRTFKRAFGLSFSQYLEAIRLQEAEKALLTTDLSISEISDRLCFSSTSYFIERFRKRHGAPPNRFRRHALKRAEE